MNSTKKSLHAGVDRKKSCKSGGIERCHPKEALCGHGRRRRSDYNGSHFLARHRIWLAELHLAEVRLAERDDLATAIDTLLHELVDLGLAGLPGLIRRAAIEAREADGGFFGFD